MAIWADYQPQLKEIFDQPKVPWPCERIVTGFPAHQPQLVVHEGEIFAQPSATILNSTDGGVSWNALCDSPMTAPAPAGTKPQHIPDALGITDQGTLLFHYTLTHNDGRPYEHFNDPTWHQEAYVVRSTDRGRTWSEPIQLDPSPHNAAGTDRSRFFRLPDGQVGLAISTHTQTRPNKPQPHENWWFEATMFVSHDDGLTWKRRGSLGRYTCEVDVLPLASGRLIAVARYQRLKLPGDPEHLIDPESQQGKIGGHSVLKQTVLLDSIDLGRTWSEPRLLTGWLQQTACLVQLSDGTLVVPFGHKTEQFGQRFLVSYDEGRTWTRRISELGQGGLFASSVVLTDDTIVTAHDNRKNPEGTYFTVQRWKAPTRQQVATDGFFEPFAIHRELCKPLMGTS